MQGQIHLSLEEEEWPKALSGYDVIFHANSCLSSRRQGGWAALTLSPLTGQNLSFYFNVALILSTQTCSFFLHFISCRTYLQLWPCLTTKITKHQLTLLFQSSVSPAEGSGFCELMFFFNYKTIDLYSLSFSLLLSLTSYSADLGVFNMAAQKYLLWFEEVFLWHWRQLFVGYCKC